MVKRNKLYLLGITLVTISIMIPITKKQIDNKEELSREEGIAYYKNTTSIDNKKEEDTVNRLSDNYIAILEIPDLNIKNGLVNKYSKYNDVKYNVKILDNSNMPDINNSNLILASHNGTSKVSYFKNLVNINPDTLIYIYYNGYKYIYKYHNSYEIDKTGRANIKRDKSVNTITLITCKEGDDTKQVVYIGYLINKETY